MTHGVKGLGCQDGVIFGELKRGEARRGEASWSEFKDLILVQKDLILVQKDLILVKKDLILAKKT